MKRLKSSIVAKSFFAALFLFIALWAAVPYALFFYAALSAAFGVCLAATIRYGRDAFVSFRSGRSGAEFLVVAVFAIVTVILLLISYWFAIRMFPDRLGWLSRSVVSVAVPWFLAWAISLALIAPDVGIDASEAKTGIWRSIALFIGGALAGFIIAISFSAEDAVDISKLDVWPQMSNRAHCSPREPIWVSSQGVYHTSNSPYRGMVVAKWCFATVAQAEAKGFRPPHGMKTGN